MRYALFLVAILSSSNVAAGFFDDILEKGKQIVGTDS